MKKPIEIGGWHYEPGAILAGERLARPPRPRHLSRAVRLPPGALPRRAAGHLHLDPVRRRPAALPRRELRDARDEGRDARRAAAATRSSRAPGSSARAAARSRSAPARARVSYCCQGSARRPAASTAVQPRRRRPPAPLSGRTLPLRAPRPAHQRSADHQHGDRERDDRDPQAQGAIGCEHTAVGRRHGIGEQLTDRGRRRDSGNRRGQRAEPVPRDGGCREQRCQARRPPGRRPERRSRSGYGSDSGRPPEGGRKP